MSLFASELKLVLRSRIAAGALLLLFLLSALAVWSGLSAAARQEAAIERVQAAHAQDIAAVAERYGKPDGDAGYAAYYTFYLTWDRPSPLAFAALGQRDIQPYTLRVRALGLQAQLYESENVNPELALPGPFDWAFVLIYLAPLVVIGLMHDLVSGEREAGRLRLLLSLPGGRGLWLRRLGVRFGLVFAALGLPLVAGLLIAATPVPLGLAGLGVAALYLGFWFGLGLLVAAMVRTSGAGAAALLGCWILLTLVLPTLASTAINRAVPAGRGIDLTLAQRETVHAAWDQPKEATFERFFVNHPEWRGTPPVTTRFHWKWYFAFHQVGDEAVAPQLEEYRASLAARERWTERSGWLLPSVATQVLLHRLADTDLAAQLAYQDSISDLHRRVRYFYYPYLFEERPFTRADFEALPAYEPRPFGGSFGWGSAAVLGLLAALFLILGLRRARRVGMAGGGASAGPAADASLKPLLT
ncbi:MAG: ABC transporter permease [Allosphingosinicella sp.]|uniref:ABC transporter permease n=1 Tax=Allosphingosinicella sp. TaxID=2823234 RepID=UPI00395E4BBC